MKFLKYITIIIISISLFHSCADQVDIPSFVRLDEIYVDSTSYDSVGTTDHRIEYAWMYINNNLQGVYKLPFLVPVQNYGEVDVEIRAGVPQLQEVGGAGAVEYPFYTIWKGKTTLTMNDTSVLKPTIRYKPGKLIQYKDDFELLVSPNNLFQKYSADGVVEYINNEVVAYEGQGYGEMLLLDGESEVVMANLQLWNIPKTADAYYIEMNYKCNSLFTVGIQTIEHARDVVSYYSSSEWKKVYINVTSAVKNLPGAGVRVYFKIKRGAEETGPKWLLIDNFKFIY